MIRPFRVLVAASVFALALASSPARADNPLGYRLMSADQAATLPRNHGTLGLEVEHGPQIASGGMQFILIRVTGVKRGMAGAAAGLHAGDQIVAVNGLVFPSVAAFAEYAGAIQPGAQATIDYLPPNAGPGQAQRATVIMGGPGAPARGGLSTGAKIGIGVAALFGCYELGCFGHRNANQQTAPNQR